jgi:uncharacterized protein (DUF1499 family)
MPSDPAAPIPTSSDRRRIPAWAAWLLAAAAALPALWLLNRLVPRPTTLGDSGGRLSACPDSPNCVCSHDPDPRHHIDPFPVVGSPRESIARLKTLLAERRHVRLVAERPDYLHFEFRTPLCRFVDDVEFLADATRPDAAVVQVRSASRLGYSDLGTNRKRIESIRREYLGAGANPSAPPAPHPPSVPR